MDKTSHAEAQLHRRKGDVAQHLCVCEISQGRVLPDVRIGTLPISARLLKRDDTYVYELRRLLERIARQRQDMQLPVRGDAAVMEMQSDSHGQHWPDSSNLF